MLPVWKLRLKMPERIMGLDVGDKWIGVALSDETGLLARSLEPIRRHASVHELAAVQALAVTWQVSDVVVGLPLNMNASIGPQAQKTLAFADQLRQHTGLHVITWDERLTTRQAERMLIEQDVRRERRKKLIDGLAAALILQGYLDHQRTVTSREETHMADDKDLMGQGIPEDEDEIITLTDEDGNEHEFVVVDVIEVEEKEYAILLPIDTEDDEEAEAVILRLEKDPEGDDMLVDIESEEEWEEVAQAYEKLLDEETEE